MMVFSFFSHLACVYFTTVSVNNYKCGNSIMAGHIKNSIICDALGGGATMGPGRFGSRATVMRTGP